MNPSKFYDKCTKLFVCYHFKLNINNYIIASILQELFNSYFYKIPLRDVYFKYLKIQVKFYLFSSTVISI